MKVTLSWSQLKIDPNAFAPEKFQQFAEEQATITVAENVERMLSGKNADGGALAPYSESYVAAIRRGTGKMSRKGGNTSPNIRLTGDLHDSAGVYHISGGAEARLSGNDQAEKLRGLESHGYRDLFGFGKQDEERIQKDFERLVNEAAEQAVKVEPPR